MDTADRLTEERSHAHHLDLAAESIGNGHGIGGIKHLSGTFDEC